MSQDLSQAAGQSIELIIGEKKWKMFPLTVGDLAAFQEYLRNKRLAAAMKITGSLKPDQAVDLLGGIIRAPIDGEQMDREMETIDGCQFVLWRSLRRGQPSLTLDQLGDMFTVEELMKSLLPLLQKLSGIGDDTGHPPVEPQETH